MSFSRIPDLISYEYLQNVTTYPKKSINNYNTTNITTIFNTNDIYCDKLCYMEVSFNKFRKDYRNKRKKA